MRDNALRIMLFFYLVSGCMAAVEITIAAPLGFQIVGLNGEPAGPQIGHIWSQMQQHELATKAAALSNSTATDPIQDGIRSLELGLAMSVEFLKLLAGVYAFEILLIFGLDWPWVAVLQGGYTVLLARAVIGHLPAISGAIRALTGLGRGVGAAAQGVGGAVGGLNNTVNDAGIADKFNKFFGRV